MSEKFNKKMPSCQAWDPQFPNAFGYHPTLGVGCVFVSLFGISFLWHMYQAIFTRERTGKRLFWLWGFVAGAFFEALGWAARTAASKCPYSTALFKMQIVLLITAPTFTMMGVYMILWVLLPILGTENFPFKPKIYLIVCLTVDFISLAAQAAGGGMASAAFGKQSDTRPGTYTMVGGIIFQMVSVLLFSALLNIMLYRVAERIWQSRNLRMVALTTSVCMACMIVRGIYRSIELLQGWRGYLITHEKYTIWLDASMMWLAVAVFNPWNPGRMLSREQALAAAMDEVEAELTKFPENETGEHRAEALLVRIQETERELARLREEYDNEHDRASRTLLED